jgi:hypothetical protein
MTAASALSKKEIKDYEFYIINKYAKTTTIKRNKIVDRLIDEILNCNEDGIFFDEEELEFKKLEAATLAKMILRKEVN